MVKLLETKAVIKRNAVTNGVIQKKNSGIRNPIHKLAHKYSSINIKVKYFL